MKTTTMLIAAAVLAVGCGNKGSDPTPAAETTKPGADRPAPPVASANATPPPAAVVATTGYSLDGIKTIPDNCASPRVILATAPASVGSSYP